MKTTLTKKRAISTILTTVIILVASVVLGSGVVLYGTSLFQGSTLTEQLTVSGAKVWVDPTDTNGLAWGAAGLRNSGDKAISVDKISVRGIDVPFTSWYATTDQTEASVANTQASFPHTGSYEAGTGGEMADSATFTSNTGGSALCTNAATADEIRIDVDGSAGSQETMCLQKLTGPISLDPGVRAVVYFQVINGTLNPIDSGASTSVNIFAGKTGAPLSLTVQNP
ncbi:hypothetical protein [Candidatus Nitrosopumilus sediminis]|uniref:Uncharacterized protein n=1 Tax=Candidatus Nitrosopumilus sediminis TaxID=1229909 RepID=K0BCL5_9ARCH|nr:hypothetical protein [Candidatus Nitrosopumilus sediminis]AFS82765.1 hypothetical protein NSED_04805 [Candidatus Nitrosopumilus sediminis]